MEIRTLAAAIATVALVTGCASSSQGLKSPRPDPVALERAADTELDRGCYLCLKSSAEKYEAAIAAGAPSASVKAAGAWALLAAREKELGLKGSDALDRLRSHRTEANASVIDAYLLVVSGLGWRSEGVSKETQSANTPGARALTAAVNSSPVSPPIALIRERALQGVDRVALYLSLSLACSGVERPRTPGWPPPITPEESRAQADSSPLLLRFRSATCGARRDLPVETSTLKALIEAEPRFHEAHYFLGALILMEGRLVSAEKEYFAAADGLPQMVAAWAMLGAVRLSIEDYDAAAQDLARALNLEPNQREAMLTYAKALNYSGRFEEAMAPARRLIEMGNWHVSDAHYWLAFSELQLGRLQDADTHVREAKRTNPMNGDTARLAGLIAYRLAELDRARAEFDLAISRNDADCESRLHLGMIHGQQARTRESVEAFIRARDCYASVAAAQERKRTEIETSALSEVRKDVALARTAQRIAASRRSQAAASYGAAEGEAERGAFDAALSHADAAAAHADFRVRIEDLRKRVAAMRARQ